MLTRIPVHTRAPKQNRARLGLLATSASGRAVAALIAMLMAFGVLVAGPVVAAYAAPQVSLTSEDATILAGENRQYTFTASNTGDEDGYNLGFAVEVPVGIGFVSSSVGAPRTYDDVLDFADEPVASPGMVLWVWEDVADLPTDADHTLTVVVDPAQPALADPRYTDDTTVFPVASEWDAVAHAYFSTDPTYLPVFNGSTGVGGTAAEEATSASGAASPSTQTTAIRIEKSEPSPESELVRGVHDEVTVYTLRVTNNDTFATDDVVVTDYLPAGLEFLECGDIDNSTEVTEEYVGSGSLGAATLADCATPASVETILVTDPASGSGLPERLAPGVYTKVVWNLGTLTAGEVRETRYAAAVPLYENTMDFDGETPTPASRGQAANLDNNNGPSTRHGSEGTPVDGDAWTNSARVEGTFPGMVFAPDAGSADALRSVSHEDDHTITAMDLAVEKTTTSGTFTQDARRTFTLALRTGEYATADSIVLTDVVGNGLCPLVPVGTPLSGGGYPDECAPAQNAGVISGAATVQSVTFDSTTGEFTLVLDLAGLTVGASGDHTVTYEVLQRADYVDAAQYGPTTSGDSFSNTVSFTAQTTLIDEVAALPGQLGTLDVWDDSAVIIESDFATITKEVLDRSAADATDRCEVTTGWVDGVDDVPTGFRPGDTVCYRLTVDFADGVATRNAAIADFLPAGLEFVSATTVDSPSWALSAPTQTGQRLEWLLGEAGAGGDRYVPAGATLQILVEARIPVGVTEVTADKPENLMKYRQENVDGDVFFLRDTAAIERDGSLSLVKGVQDVNGNSTLPADSQSSGDGDSFLSNRDGIEVRQGDIVTYRIDVAGVEETVSGVTVWDALPPGITEDDLVPPILGGGSRTVVDNKHNLNPSEFNGRTIIIWDDVVVPPEGVTLSYAIEIPQGVSVSTDLVNEASVISFDAGNNVPTGLRLYPEGSLDALATPNHPGTDLRDASNVYLPSVDVVKNVIDSRVEASNTLTQAVIGELVTYEYSVTIPGGTTVYNGALTDVLPAQLELYSGFTPVWAFETNGVSATQPPGFTLDEQGALRFPSSWDVPAGETHTFTVTVQAFPPVAGNGTHNQNRDNVATFSSTANLDAASTTYTDTDDARVTIVTPNPSLQKRITHVDDVANSADPAPASADSAVTFELRVSNQNNRPTSFDTVVTDCVPGEFTDIVIVSASQGTAVAETAAGCEGTRITWNVGEVHGTASRTLTFTAIVNSEPSGLEVYRNTANLVGYGLPSGTESGVRAEYTRSSSASVEVPGGTQTKTVTPSNGSIGDTVTYTLTTTLPPRVNFYDAYVRDAVPQGLAITDTRIVSSDVPMNNAAPATTDGSASAVLTWTANTSGGDILASDTERTIVIEVDATIVDIPSNTRGTTRTNTAALYWNTDNGNDNSGVKSPDSTATVTVHEPQLSIAKTVNGLDADTVEPGETFTYSVTVRNANTATTSTAHEVTITDTVPVGVDVDRASIIASGGTPSPATGRVTSVEWTIDALERNASQTFTYTATLAPSDEISASDSFTNVVEIDEYFSLPSDDPNADERREYSGPEADAVIDPLFPVLDVTKSAAASPGYLGEEHDFTIVIVNTGGSAAVGLEIVDVLPADWSYVPGSAAIGGTAYPDATVNGQELTWDTAISLSPSGSITLTYRAVAGPDAATGASVDHTNTVVVTADDTSGAPSNADGPYTDDSEAHVQIHEADLMLVKSHSGTAVAGTEFDWTISVSNHADATDSAVGPFTVTETLPAGVAYNDGDFTGTGWTQTGRTGNIVTFVHAGPSGLTPGASLPTLTLTVTLDDDLTEDTTLTNEARVDGRTHDVDPSNNEDDDTITVTTEADLVLEKTITDTSFVAGEDAVWTITVRNDGPSVSRGPITVTDTLPEGVDLAGSTASGTGLTCGTADAATRELECIHAGDLAVGDTFTITVTTPVLSATTEALYNHALVTPTTPDTDLDNNEDTASVDPIGTRVDLELAKSLVSDGLTVGETGRYRIDVTNHGPSDALNVTVIDTLPAGITYAGGLTGDWTCAPDTDDPRLVECELAVDAGTLVAGASTWFEFDVTLASDAYGEVTNVAVVSTTTDETNYANNDDEVTTNITTTTGLELDKATTATVLTGDDTVEYTLQVTNSSASDADNVILTDTLPAQLRYVSATSAAPTGSNPAWDTCTITGQDADGYGGTIECVLTGALLAGADAPVVTVEAVVHPTAGSNALINDILNEAAVTWTDLADENPGRDDDEERTPLLWVNITSFEQCFADTPYIDFRLIASAGIDLSTQPITLDWYKDNNQNGIPEDPASLATDDPTATEDPSAAPVATFTIDGTTGILTTDDGTEYPVIVTTGPDGAEISGRADWPGTVLDANGVGVAWPGYRLALPGETPDFENLIYDETVFGANLRPGAMLSINVNPTAILSLEYPAATADCAMLRTPTLELTKQATVTEVRGGDQFSYFLDSTNVDYGSAYPVTLTDPIPADLTVLAVTPDVPTDATAPAWDTCVVTGQDAHGYGGEIVCELDRHLGYGQSAPRVTVDVEVHPSNVGETITNTATLTWMDPDGDSPDGSVSDTAIVNAGWLARTGAEGVTLTLLVMTALFGLGGALMFAAQRRERRSAD